MGVFWPFSWGHGGGGAVETAKAKATRWLAEVVTDHRREVGGIPAVAVHSHMIGGGGS